MMLLLNFTHLAVAVLAFFVSKQDTTRQLLLGKGRRGNAQQQQQQKQIESSKEESSTAHHSVSPGTSAAVLSTSTDASSASSESTTSSLLRTSASLQLPAADAIAQGAIHAAQTAFDGPKPITVTVLDAYGHVLVQKRMDGCPPGVYPQLSCAKAKTCIHLQTSSRQFRQKYLQSTSRTTTHNPNENDPSALLVSPQPAQFTQAATMVSAVGHGELIPIAGGIVILDSETGQVVGAVGVSGAAADEDEYCALAGVEAVNALTRATATTSRSNDPHPSLLRTIPAQHSCQTVVSARPTATVVM